MPDDQGGGSDGSGSDSGGGDSGGPVASASARNSSLPIIAAFLVTFSVVYPVVSGLLMTWADHFN